MDLPPCRMASKLPLRLFNESSTQCLPTFSTNGLSFTLMMSLSGQTLILRLCFVMNLFLNVLPKFGIQFKPTKCAFFSQDLEILGHHVTSLGWFPTSKGTEAISVMPCPHYVSSVKRFLGMVNYFRDYVRNMASRTKHLHSLLCKGTPFVCTDAHEAEFTDLKDALLSPDTMLYHPDWNSPFELHTDASKHGIGAMLAQWHNGKLRPVKFFSRSFTAWKVVGQPPTRNILLSSIRLSISDPICLDTNSPSSQIMRISSGLPVFSPSSPNLHAGVFLWQSLILKLNIVLVLPVSFQMYLVALP